MCGIIGIVNKVRGNSFAQVKAMTDSISHRGPDSEGIWNDEFVTFGHRRLSIIELSSLGHQPMLSDDKNLVIVFNGEIFNYKELKKELEAQGLQFKSNSDTEVILQAFNYWNTDCFAKLNGMFALAIYDISKQEVFLARDHAGIKPLYYFNNSETLIFGSEVRAFKAYNPNWPKNTDWESNFLSFGFIPFPFTTLQDVFLLPKGSFLKYNIETRELSQSCFTNFSYTNAIDSEKEALEIVRATMLESIKRHMIADAPLGIFLSGGIDSSLVALIADRLGHKNLNTLSITFNEASFNEEPFQNIVLKNMQKHNHLSYKVDGSMFMDNLDDIFSAMDQPSWDGVNSYFISKCAHDAGLKAVLSGLGGDELFGGYPSFQRIDLLKKLAYLPRFVKSITNKTSNEKLSRISFLNIPGGYGDYLFLRGAFPPILNSKLTGKPVAEIFDKLYALQLPGYPIPYNGNKAAYLESNVYMENQLLKDSDYMSMWHSLELRVPFLDKELMQVMHSISPNVKYNFSQPKYLLTKAFSDLLPNEVVFRKKQGFTFPFAVWLKSNLNHFRPMLPKSEVSELILNKFLAGQAHWSKVWALIVYERFRQNAN